MQPAELGIEPKWARKAILFFFSTYFPPQLPGVLGPPPLSSTDGENSPLVHSLRFTFSSFRRHYSR